MVNGSIHFTSNFDGITFDAIEIVPALAGIQSTLLTADEVGGVHLEVRVINLATVEEAISLASSIADHVGNVLAFSLAKRFENFKLGDQSLQVTENCPDGTERTVNHLGSTLFFRMNVVENLVLGPDRRGQLKTALELPRHPGRNHLPLFRSALGFNDPMARFMSLYSILLSLNNDSQEDVDRFVLRQQPAVPTNAPFRPRRSGVPETLYTRLRNQVGHVRPGTTIEGTRVEMERHLQGLIEITKAAIGCLP